MVYYHVITDNPNINKVNNFGLTFNDSDISYIQNNIIKLKGKKKATTVTKLNVTNPHLYKFNRIPFLTPGITAKPLRVNDIPSENANIYIGMTNDKHISKKNIGFLLPIIILETANYYIEGIIKISLYNKNTQQIGQTNYINIESKPNSTDIYTSDILEDMNKYIYDNKLTILITVLNISSSISPQKKLCHSVNNEINELVNTIEYLQQENKEYKEMISSININDKIKNDFQEGIDNLDEELYQNIMMLIDMLLTTEKSDLIIFDIINRIQLSDNIKFNNFKNLDQSNIDNFSKNVNKLAKMSEELKYVVQYKNELQKKEDELKLLKEEAQESNLCKICYDKPINTVFSPCGHMLCCIECSTDAITKMMYDSDEDEYYNSDVKECPICRTNVKEIIITYLP
jgi:hypothetical protein